MNENAVQVLEQYDLEVERTFGGRGAVMAETAQGLRLVREFSGSRLLLPYEQQLMRCLKEKKVCRSDLAMPNREGGLLSMDGEETAYIVKEQPPGHPCDPRNREDLLRAMNLLASVHRTARGIWELPGEEKFPRLYGPDVRQEYEKHNRELKKVQNYMRGRRNKGDFELLFLKYAPYYQEEGRRAAQLLVGSAYNKLAERARREGHICHGEYIHHNILFDRREPALLNFDRCCVDVQVHDICLFLRKMLEKQGWDPDLGSAMITAYECILPLAREEKQYLALRLYYPDKVWKLANRYFHANKAWIPEKSCEKLEKFVSQEEQRLYFLRELFDFPPRDGIP